MKVVDNYLTAADRTGKFPSQVERNLVFEVEDIPYQVRIEQSVSYRDGGHSADYALLMRWSSSKEDWSIIAKRRPRDLGIWAPGEKWVQKPFYTVEEELIRAAEDFEELRTTRRRRAEYAA